jgi:NADP-dependent 3-hydroxy acid dehydrogenase YdfG
MSDFPCPNASQDLSGQVALVTGATSGLGWRFAQALAAAGATVVPTGRREDRLAALTSMIADNGGTAYPIRMDMTDADAVISAVEEAENAVGTVTIAVNNAGVPTRNAPTKCGSN